MRVCHGLMTHPLFILQQIHILCRLHTILLLEALGKIAGTAETGHFAHFADAILALLQQAGSRAETYRLYQFVRRYRQQRLYLIK